MPLIETLADTFSGTLAQWTVNAASIVGGELAVQANHTAGTPTYAYANSTAGYQWSGSALFAKVSAMPGVAGTNAANAQMWVLDPAPADTVARIGFEYRAAANALDCIGQSGATYAAIGTTTTLTYSATTHAWLRLRHTGTSILWETSPDGTTWTVRRTLTAVPTWANKTTLTASFQAFRTAGTNDTFRVDNVNTAPGSTPPVQPPAETPELQQPVTVVRRNLCPNPALANNATGWTVRFFSGASVVAARTAVSGMSKSWAFRGTGTSSNQAVLTAAPTLAPVAPNERYSGTMEARFSAVPSSPFLMFMWFDASGTWTKYSAHNISGVAVGSVVRPSAVASAPADAVYGAVGISWLYAEDIIVDATAARLEQVADSALPYGDGDAPGWTWTGAAGSSSSSTSYAIGTERRNICPNPALAVDAEGWWSGNTLEGSRVAVAGMERAFAWQITQSSPTTTLARSVRTSVSPGQRYTCTAQWRFNVVPSSAAQFSVVFADATNTTVAVEHKIITTSVSAGTPGWTVAVATAPTNAVVAYLQVAAVTTTVPVTVQMTAVRIEAVEDDAMPYRDGDSYGWAWDSTPGVSTSSTGPDRLRRSPRLLTAVSRSYTV